MLHCHLFFCIGLGSAKQQLVCWMMQVVILKTTDSDLNSDHPKLNWLSEMTTKHWNIETDSKYKYSNTVCISSCLLLKTHESVCKKNQIAISKLYKFNKSNKNMK